jgi:hypothetical protein
MVRRAGGARDRSPGDLTAAVVIMATSTIIVKASLLTSHRIIFDLAFATWIGKFLNVDIVL